MSRLDVAKVHRNIETRPKWLFGFEPFDFWILVGAFFVLMALFRDLFFWNLLFVAGAAVTLHIVKRNKPPGFTKAVVRYWMRGPFFSAAARGGRTFSRDLPITIREELKGRAS